MRGDKVDARRKRRCSAKVALVLLGSISIAGCDRTPQEQQVYKSLRDCSEEWGIQKCDPADNRYPTGHYFGPSYGAGGFHSSGASVGTAGTVSGAGPGGSRAIGTVSRGGFGSSAGFHGGGS